MKPKDHATSDSESFLKRMGAAGASNSDTAKRIIDWAKDRNLKRRYTPGQHHESLMCDLRLGQTKHKLFTLETDGHVWILFDQLAARFPARDAVAKEAFFDELKARLATVPGRVSEAAVGAQTAWRLEHIDLSSFLNVLEWICRELERHHELELASIRRKQL